ncbi:MAG: diguanylate cyclase [Deltaproteobacteria bacterium]|nr:diguanylate cyclase [Deltaproteobacteria bacterium]MBM4323449.1 diguanylate cyclase [Deltaproteobacteria bacterium]
MADRSTPKNNKSKVLIVDDVPDTREIIQKLLRYEGYDVITASTGEEGLSKAEEEKPDIILMDINLPGIDGTEALRRIRAINPIQCVIMLTAYATVENAIQALKEGASDFIKKPFENEHLVHVVNQTLEKHLTLKEKEKLEEEVRRLSITDDLTGLYNHRHFFKTLASEMIRRERQKTSLSLLMFDLDNFKKYNDLHGHLEGDRVLKIIGEVIRNSIRNNVDSGYRYGGDEFAALLIGATRNQALHIAERIRSTIQEAGFEKITVSIGLAEFKDQMDIESFVKSADNAMYTAKHSGGNRVHTSSP